jgi:hypothetical protein
MILGISGRIGSGKDTVGLIIQYLDWFKAANSQGLSTNMSFEEWVNLKTAGYPFNHKHWEIKKYAGKLKEIACILTGCTLEQLEDQDFKKLQIGSDWGMTYRELLQKLGTEAMRNGLHENVWVNALMADYNTTGFNYTGCENKVIQGEWNYPNWIITDMRFPNEFDAVKSRNGITIRVNRTNRWNKPQDIEHASETALDNHNFDYVIDNNGSMSDLITKVREMLTQNKII